MVYLLGRVICKSWFIWQQTYYQTYRKIDLKAGLFYTETFYSLISHLRFQPGILVETDQPYQSSLGLICSFELKSNVKPDLSLSSKTFIDYIYATESLGKICWHWARPLACFCLSPSFHQNTSPKWLTPSFFNMHLWRHPGRTQMLCMLSKMIHMYTNKAGAPTGPHSFDPAAHWLMLWLLQLRSSPLVKTFNNKKAMLIQESE